MTVDFKTLSDTPRILITVDLKPMAGHRFQPTGFPDLGPATYTAPDDTPMLLVESAQSMANRLEAVCWDEAAESLESPLSGLPYVNVKLAHPDLGAGHTTNSLQEFHRLNSPYIMSGVRNGEPFAETLRKELGLGVVKKPATDGEKSDKDGDDSAGVVNLRQLAKVCFKYDPNSLVHGVFLEKIAGRLRHPRALSAFIEAEGVGRADSGGVKFDRALPKPSVVGLKADAGYGNVPFHRAEFTAKKLTGYFSVDLAQLRGYGLPDPAWQLLAVLSLWKVRRFLETGLRLRTACDLELAEGEKSIVVKRPVDGFALPPTDALTAQLADLISKCNGLFASPAVTELVWTGDKKKKEKAPTKKN